MHWERETSECLRSTPEDFANLRLVVRLRKFWSSQDKNLTYFTREKLAGIVMAFKSMLHFICSLWLLSLHCRGFAFQRQRRRRCWSKRDDREQDQKVHKRIIIIIHSPVFIILLCRFFSIWQEIDLKVLQF